MRRGFTLIELLVVIAIIAILAAMLLPVLGRAKERAARSVCMANLKQIALASFMYAQDYDEVYPAGTWPTTVVVNLWPVLHNPGVPVQLWTDWTYPVYPYVKNGAVFDCPTSPVKYPNGGGSATDVDGNYVYNVNGVYDFPKTIAGILYPAEIVLVMDGGDSYLIPGADTMTSLKGTLDEDWNPLTLDRASRHNEQANVAFVDGHVNSQPRDWLFNVNQGPAYAPYGYYVDPST